MNRSADFWWKAVAITAPVTALMLFTAGFLTAWTIRDHQKSPECIRAEENAERFGKAVAHALNGGAIKTNDVTASCHVRKS